METAVTVLMPGEATLVGVIASSSESRAVMKQMIDELTRRMEKHDSPAERTCLLEREMALKWLPELGCIPRDEAVSRVPLAPSRAAARAICGESSRPRSLIHPRGGTRTPRARWPWPA